MHEILAISCLNKTQLLILEIGSDLWQLNGWPYSTAPKEPSHGKVSEKEILYWIFNLRKHLQSVWWSLRKFAYGFWETHILWLLSPSSVSNNVKETYGVPPGSSRFLAYVTRPHEWRVRWGVWKKTFSMERKNGEAVFVRGRHLFCVPSYTGDTRLSWLSSDSKALFQA